MHQRLLVVSSVSSAAVLTTGAELVFTSSAPGLEEPAGSDGGEQPQDGRQNQSWVSVQENQAQQRPDQDGIQPLTILRIW